jgi:hypothetical protein
MDAFRIWNRVPHSDEWHLSVKHLVGRLLVTRRFAAGWAARSDSYLGNRSGVSSARGAHRWSCLMASGPLRVTNALGSGSSASTDRLLSVKGEPWDGP